LISFSAKKLKNTYHTPYTKIKQQSLMETLPHEIVLEIFNNIQKITDKRQFLRTCKTYNDITQKSFKIFESHFKSNHYIKIDNYCVEKFTLELCHDSYFNLIPITYITPNNKTIVSALAIYGNIEVLQLAINKGCKLIGDIYNLIIHTVTNGHLDTFIWCKNFCDVENYTFSMFNVSRMVIQYGHLHILKWIIETRYVLSQDACTWAAINDQLKTLIYLSQNGYKYDYNTYVKAKEFGHTHIIEWLKNNGCPEKEMNLCDLLKMCEENDIRYYEGHK